MEHVLWPSHLSAKQRGPSSAPTCWCSTSDLISPGSGWLRVVRPAMHQQCQTQNFEFGGKHTEKHLDLDSQKRQVKNSSFTNQSLPATIKQLGSSETRSIHWCFFPWTGHEWGDQAPSVRQPNVHFSQDWVRIHKFWSQKWPFEPFWAALTIMCSQFFPCFFPPFFHGHLPSCHAEDNGSDDEAQKETSAAGPQAPPLALDAEHGLWKSMEIYGNIGKYMDNLRIWLVVSTYPSEKDLCSSLGMMKFPTEWKNRMFHTTN